MTWKKHREPEDWQKDTTQAKWLKWARSPDAQSLLYKRFSTCWKHLEAINFEHQIEVTELLPLKTVHNDDIHIHGIHAQRASNAFPM
jgi:hypothetical protein